MKKTSEFLEVITSIVSGAASWISAFAKVAVGYVPATQTASASWNPNIITFMILFGFVGVGIGLLKRLMRA